jgi:hypothetical protein
MLYRLIVLAVIGIGLVLTEVGCSQPQPTMDKAKGGTQMAAPAGRMQRRVPQ